MSSKMRPLWLVFENADPEAPPIYIMFKSGDDLRQDILTIQILRMMDRVYLCVAIFFCCGVITCVITSLRYAVTDYPNTLTCSCGLPRDWTWKWNLIKWLPQVPTQMNYFLRVFFYTPAISNSIKKGSTTKAKVWGWLRLYWTPILHQEFSW